jgi:hypothetical protein
LRHGEADTATAVDGDPVAGVDAGSLEQRVVSVRRRRERGATTAA